MREIPVGSMVAQVDNEDYERISAHKWSLLIDGKNGKPYARREIWVQGGNRGTSTSMHREVMGLRPGDPREVDHLDFEATLDNQKGNLRVATRSQNNCNRGMRRDNTSGIKGVSADPVREGFWKAQIMHQKKAYTLGSFPEKELAAEAYRVKALELHGEYARMARTA